MTTIWKSAKKEETDKTFSGAILSSWSRQQKLVMGASFVILGLLLAVVACSTQSSKPVLAGVSGPSPNSTAAPVQVEVAATAAQPIPDAPVASKKKVQKKRPANVVYSDPNSGVSFLYPRKFALASGNDAQRHFGNTDTIPMNFVHSGGVTVAMVAVPNSLYPKTDFASALFTVNVNRNLSEQECSHFAFVDTNDADGEPIDARKVKVGSVDMEMTEELTGSANHQLETEYYHHYENAACYEYVIGVATDGYSPQSGVQPINRDAVFARLEKILATVKTATTMKQPEAKQPATEPTVAGAGSPSEPSSK
jgi:hypothetical protein